MIQKPLMAVPVLDLEVYGGGGVPTDWQDWKITSFRDIRPITGARPGDRFGAIKIIGDSLTEVGILSGDMLIMKLTAKKFETGRLAVWQTPHGRLVKYAFEEFDGTVTLHNRNGWTQSWHADDLKLIGVVVRVERDL